MKSKALMVLGVLFLVFLSSLAIAQSESQLVDMDNETEESIPIGEVSDAEVEDSLEKRTIGDEDAPIQIVMYTHPFEVASSKWFEEKNFQRLKQEYLDEGRAKFTFRYKIMEEIDLNVKPLMAVECAGRQGKFLEYITLIYNDWNRDELTSYASQVGLDMQQFNSCLESPKTRAVIEEDEKHAQSKEVTGLPTFFIDGTELRGAEPYSKFVAVLNEKLGNYCPETCELNEECVEIGHREAINDSNKYCGEDGQWITQKEEGTSCQNNYECYSNQCSNGECINLKEEIEENRGLLQEILDWIKTVFS